MNDFTIGVILPSVSSGIDLREAARHAEDAGLDGVWHGDHLAAPTLDVTIALATAAAVTSRITVGASVLVPAIRPLAWTAKQVATLQYVSGGRLVLGVGSGGGPGQWALAGVPYEERGPRTDAALDRLPGMLTGELSPPVPMPPVWVGNASGVAIRRAARAGDGWFPSLIPPKRVAEGAARLAELAAEHGRPVPTIAIGATGALGPGAPSREEIAADIADVYGGSAEEAAEIPLTGSPREAAEKLAAYRDAGARHAVVGVAGGDWRAQVELLAEVRAILHERH